MYQARAFSQPRAMQCRVRSVETRAHAVTTWRDTRRGRYKIDIRWRNGGSCYAAVVPATGGAALRITHPALGRACVGMQRAGQRAFQFFDFTMEAAGCYCAAMAFSTLHTRPHTRLPRAVLTFSRHSCRRRYALHDAPHV